jgi:hypothetical protein
MGLIGAFKVKKDAWVPRCHLFQKAKPTKKTIHESDAIG